MCRVWRLHITWAQRWVWNPDPPKVLKAGGVQRSRERWRGCCLTFCAAVVLSRSVGLRSSEAECVVRRACCVV